MKLIRRYFDSPYFICITYLFTLAAWWLDLSTYAMIYYTATGALIVVFDAKRINIMTLIAAAIIIPRSSLYQDNIGIILGVTIAIFPFALYDFIKHKINFRSEIFLSMVLLLIANALSLVNANQETMQLTLLGIGQFALYGFVFIYFYNYHQKDSYVLIGKNAFALGLTIGAQMALYIAFYEGEMIGKDIDFGWAISNGIAILVTMLIPLNIALYLHNQKHSYVLVGIVVDLIVIIFTLSKGAYVAVAVIAIPLAIISLMYAKKKRKFIVDMALVVLILFGVMYGLAQIEKVAIGIIQYLTQMDARGWLNDEARIELFTMSWNMFLEKPLFGHGSYTKPPGFYHHHNFIFQTLATTGIVGMLAFGYYLVVLVKKSLKAHSYSLMVFVMLLAITVHGLVDHAWYNPFVMVVVALATAVLLKQSDIDEIQFKEWLHKE